MLSALCWRMMRASQPGELMGCRAAVWGHELHDSGFLQPGIWVQQPSMKENQSQSTYCSWSSIPWLPPPLNTYNNILFLPPSAKLIFLLYLLSRPVHSSLKCLPSLHFFQCLCFHTVLCIFPIFISCSPTTLLIFQLPLLSILSFIILAQHFKPAKYLRILPAFHCHMYLCGISIY